MTARGARAKALARLDCGDEAEPLARDAAATAAGTGLVNLAADALLDLAEVHEATGHGEPAIRAADEALELYLRKGNVVSAQRARTVLARLRPSAPEAGPDSPLMPGRRLCQHPYTRTVVLPTAAWRTPAHSGGNTR